MDKIKITGLCFYGYHGVFDAEASLGQKFLIDCEFGIDTSGCGDDLAKTINYGAVALAIVEYATTNRFALLEMLANNLAKYLLKEYPLMDFVTLAIHKPQAPIPTQFEDVELTITRKWATAYLATGSNLGDRVANMNLVVELIKQDENIILIKESSLIATAPYGVLDQPDFLNGAIKIKTTYTPRELLAFCHRCEDGAHRVRHRKWGERTLDVDIVMYDQTVMFTDDLKIPHPEMHLRSFVLQPLVEIEPYLVHPVYQKNVTALLQELAK